jgi:predicted nucleic acid-binding Zn ribbon protein
MSHDDDELDDRDLPDESDMDDSDEPELLACPNCRKMISEDAERCHHCGSYISREDKRTRVPYWLVAVLLVMIAIILFWSFR